MNTLHFSVIDSTNKYLLNHYEELSDYTFVSADLQTAGKGRSQRQWQSEDGKNLLFSLLLKEKSLLSQYRAISAVAGLSVAKVLESYGIRDVSVKWPNDVYVNGKKITGILLQGISHYELECIVVGIGINVNQVEFEGDYRRRPTSAAIELGRTIDLEEFKNRVYTQIENDMKLLHRGHNFVAEIREYDYLKGLECYAEVNGVRKQVQIIGINNYFELDVIVDGMKRSLGSGEISFHAEDI